LNSTAHLGSNVQSGDKVEIKRDSYLNQLIAYKIDVLCA